MKHLLRNTALALTLTLGLCATFSARVQDGNRQPSRHAAAVKRCKDDYEAARRAAKNIADSQAQQAALATAQRNYNDCIKEASKVH